MDVWNGPAYTELRGEHAEHDFDRLHRLGIECDWCYGNRYTDCEDMVDPRQSFMTLDSRATVAALLDPGPSGLDARRGAPTAVPVRLDSTRS